jgi:hypothetical protein
MILDEIRARYPRIGIGLFALEPGQPVTLESYVDGQVFSFTADTVAGAIAKAFPELANPICPNTGLPCVPGCDRKTCAGLHVPLNEWPALDHETVEPEPDDPPPAATVFD